MHKRINCQDFGINDLKNRGMHVGCLLLQQVNTPNPQNILPRLTTDPMSSMLILEKKVLKMHKKGKVMCIYLCVVCMYYY